MEQGNRRLATLERGLTVFLLFAIVFLSFGQLLARNLFNAGFMWVEEALRIMVLWLVFAGAALCAEYGKHIRIDFLPALVRKASIRRGIHRFAYLFEFLICCLLLLAAVDYFRRVGVALPGSVFRGVPDWAFRLVIPYAFLVLCLRAAFRLAGSFNREACEQGGAGAGDGAVSSQASGGRSCGGADSGRKSSEASVFAGKIADAPNCCDKSCEETGLVGASCDSAVSGDKSLTGSVSDGNAPGRLRGGIR